MLFNSIPFVLLLLVTFGLYYLPGLRRWQVQVLVLSSLVFYSWEAPWLLLLLLGSVGFNAALTFVAAFGPKRRLPRLLVTGLVFNLFVIALFKYGGLAVRTLQLQDGDWGRWLSTLPLPIGISFYTFESISLLMDLVRCRDRGHSVFIPAQFGDHLKRTSLFVAFFPHLISGPILRADQFYPQIVPKLVGAIPWESVFRRCVLGFFLKTVVADNLKDSTQVLEYPMFLSFSSPTLLLLLFAYSMQIFADFAGYSLIAIGLAQMFGYHLPDNFNFPYIATSLGDFWRRWHISLSSWLRDYLYIPLGGSRKGEGRTYVNLFLVMALGGLWHGAAWSYSIWGIFHGLGLALERAVLGEHGTRADRIPVALRRLAVFLFVTAGWLLFKLTNFGHVRHYLAAVRENWSWRFVGEKQFVAASLFCLPVVLYHAHALSPRLQSVTRRFPSGCYALLLLAILVSHGLPGAFIYFQF